MALELQIEMKANTTKFTLLYGSPQKRLQKQAVLNFTKPPYLNSNRHIDEDVVTGKSTWDETYSDPNTSSHWSGYEGSHEEIQRHTYGADSSNLVSSYCVETHRGNYKR